MLWRYLAVFLLAAVGSAALADGVQEPVAPEAPGGAMRAWELVARFSEERHDVTGLARQVLELSPEQEDELNRMAGRRKLDEARLLDELRRDYAERVRGLLDEQQRARYDRVMAALDELTEEVTGAGREFLDAVGLDEEEHPLAPGERISLADPMRFLDVDSETRERLVRLRARKHRALAEALDEMPGLETLEDPAAWEQYREKYRELERRAEQEFIDELGEMLSPEEFEQFHTVEQAIARYRERLQAAQREAFAVLHETLGFDEED